MLFHYPSNYRRARGHAELCKNAAQMRADAGYRRETGVRSGNEILDAVLKDAEPAVPAFVPAGKQDEILMLLRLDRALLELFAVHGRNMTAYHTAKAKYGLS